MAQYLVRNLEPSDYEPIIASLDDWWDGRNMALMLPRLFFMHFRQTSFLVESDGERLGFLAGFLSQTYDNEAYVHFLGVRPDCRGQGLGCALYASFFAAVRAAGRDTVRLVTSPLNRASVAFHTHLGFALLPGDVEDDGAPYQNDYDGPGESRVLFVKRLEA